MPKFYKGKFVPKNPQKYKGDVTNIVYRSSWELRCMRRFDGDPNILEWNSEDVIVQYVSPLDGKVHRYFVDFTIKMRDRAGNISVHMLEVKPKAQTIPPVVQPYKKKPSKKYITEVSRWGVNEAKWNAARAFCAKRGWQFHVITEEDLFGKK